MNYSLYEHARVRFLFGIFFGLTKTFKQKHNHLLGVRDFYLSTCSVIKHADMFYQQNPKVWIRILQKNTGKLHKQTGKSGTKFYR